MSKEIPQLYDIPIEELEVWKEANVRKTDVLLHIEDLAGNIKKFGVQSPLLVLEKGKNKKYLVFSGQRRYEASKIANMKTRLLIIVGIPITSGILLIPILSVLLFLHIYSDYDFWILCYWIWIN